MDKDERIAQLEVQLAERTKELGPWRILKQDAGDKTWQCVECKVIVCRGIYPTHFGHTKECSYSAWPIIERAEKAEAALAQAQTDANWILVKDERPSQSMAEVLTYSAYSKLVKVEHASHVRYLWDCSIREGEECYFTYWRPLPDGPDQAMQDTGTKEQK